MSETQKSTITSSPQSQNKGKKFVYRDGRFSKQRFQKRKDQNFLEADELMEVVEEQEVVQLTKDFSSFNIEQIFQENGADLNSFPKYTQWLPLHYYDDITFDDFTNEEWGLRLQEGSLHARALSRTKGKYSWKTAEVISYEKTEDKFRGSFSDDKTLFILPRIFVIFDSDNPWRFAERIATAQRSRIYADSLIRYNYYIENMPLNEGYELETNKRKRLESLAINTHYLDGVDTTALLLEINNDYSKALNKMLFDKYLESSNEDLLLHNLTLPAKIEKDVPYYGLLELESKKGAKEIYMFNLNEVFIVEPKSFEHIFKEFCLATLTIKNEVVTALQEIKRECLKVTDLDIFNLRINKAVRYEEYKQLQDSESNGVKDYMKTNYLTEMITIIRNQFQEVEKGWFNIKDSNKGNYDLGKLKRFLTLVRLMMQDSLLSLCLKSFRNYADWLRHFMPIKVDVIDTNNVMNQWPKNSENEINETETPALFAIDLLKSTSNDEYLYSTPPKNFLNSVLTHFDRVLEDFSRIPDIEQKVLSELYKTHQRVESFIKSPLRPTEKPEIYQDSRRFQTENHWVWNIYEEIKRMLENAITPLAEYLKKFDKFKDVLILNPNEYVEKLEKEDPPKEIQDLKNEIVEFQKKDKILKESLPEVIRISCFQIHCKDLLLYLTGKYANTIRNLKDLIAKRAKNKTQKIFEGFQNIHSKIKEKPKDIEKLTEVKEYMDGIPKDLEGIRIEINECLEIYGILEEFNYKFSIDDLNKKWLIFGGPKDTLELIEQTKTVLEKDVNRFKDDMKNKQEEFKENIDNLEKTIQNFSQYQNINQHAEVSKAVESINDSLKLYTEEAKKYNARESLFGHEATDYNKVSQMAKEFLPYSNLWLTTTNWFKNIVSWQHDEWNKLDALGAEKFVEEGLRTLGGVIRFFRDKELGPVLKISESVRAQIEEFRPKVPLMVALRQKGMKDRHWTQVSEAVGFEVKPDEGFTFTKVLEMGLMQHIDVCCEIGERAAKEFNIENKLNDMIAMWEKINFDLLSYKQITSVIRNYDDVQNILDEHILNTQSMQFSPYKKPFEEKIVNWYAQLKLISDILEEWGKCQGNWMYLQPIFDSPDISKQLPGEFRKFKAVDTTWKNIMTHTKSVINVLKVCNLEGLLEKLQDNNKNLEIIQKELNNYLERKRERFARFYFLSNEDLLEILSQTKEPTSVQPHLKKVFENVHQIEFDDMKLIKAMFSAEREKIDFVKPVNPVNRNVEDWMNDVEDQMKASVRAALLNSVQDYKVTERTKWVLQHPGQCVLNGSQITWTYEVEEALMKNTVKQYWETKLNKQLLDLVELVRTKLTKQQQVSINALIVIDVHAKDVVERLWKNQIDNINAFEWISQLRYYWEPEKEKDTTYNCFVKCIQTRFPYGYEYLGNTLRLVITPLTDKCYMTLMGALKLNLGGAPAGPAGTGKTESVKDLAKALAKQCVVFNCSESMDYIMVGKFFKGLASSGAWCCFDEFNRINIEVLSVIAQQLLFLFRKKAEGALQVTFEQSEIKIQPSFSVFVTMNPGYAGRTELPDNLKALFRSVAMMVPDYAMIGEIMLYSFGFNKGRDLARKMVATFKLSSEQLSSQDHYDYGMRAVRSVINAAGLLKSAEPDMDEEKLLLRALRDVNVPKFLKGDLPLFENIIKDLFPGVERPAVNYGALLDSINAACEKFELMPVQPFIDKVLQLYDTIQVRHGLMLVGPTGGGKTCNYKVLQAAMTSLDGKGYNKVHTYILNPKSITMGQLYGQFNEQTHEWTDGVLAYIVRETVKDQSPDKQWVIFDGPVDSLWIESMNTVLDDNKKLCLNSGQILTLTPPMTMMFEVEDLAVASPATVSRCGMVYMEPVALGLKPLLDSWIGKLPKNFKEKKSFIPTLQKLFDGYLEPSIEFLRKDSKEIIQTYNNNLLQSLMRLFDCFLANYKETDNRKVTPEEIDLLESLLEPFFVFSLIWSVGCTVDYPGREKMNLYLRGLMMTNKASFPFPEAGLVYDYRFIVKEKKFVLWTEGLKNFEIDPKLIYNEIMVPTNDSTRNIFLMNLLIVNNNHILCPGPTGTGKSQNIYNLLSFGLSEEFQYIALTYSAQTSANQTQDSIDSKLGKRRKGYYGPDLGKKCVIFVDDLNMPKKELYGAQPPIEILRQYLDHKGWYNRKDLAFMKLEDIILLAAMGPPGGGRTKITDRMCRHFNILGYTELDKETVTRIFTVLLGYFLKKFSESIKEVLPEVVESVLHVYETVKKELLPTPTKSHYTFNLRDISKVFQGICSGNPKSITEPAHLMRLWFHENMRVFHDRLINDEDRKYMKKLLYNQFERFGLTEENVINQERIIFGDYFQGRDVEPRNYVQTPDLKSFLHKMESFQEDYNNEAGYSSSKKSMKLVLFLDACEHISRITRILRQPQGHALLLGVGGSGRQSLSKMSTYIAGYPLVQIEVIKNYNMKIWREDLKQILMKAGVDNKQITFLFVDTQIIHEQMLEDINNVLNSGDVANLYAEKEMEEIVSSCKNECIKKGLQPNKMNIYTQYLLRVRKNIHLIICMSPLSDIFTTRLRMFPSLVNCCTLNWFTEWPEEALVGVGKGLLIDYERELGIEGQTNAFVEVFKNIHKSVENISIRFLLELRRHNYVTPKSYLELLALYIAILKEKKTDLRKQVDRLKGGLNKLVDANKQVEEMQALLIKKQPELEKAQEETEKMMKKLVVERKEADETQKIVAKEEAEASKQEAEARELEKKQETAVEEANIILDNTLKEVQKLKKDHLVEIKSLPNPPEATRVTLGGVVILFQDHIKKNLNGEIVVRPDPDPKNFGKKIEDYFETAKRYLLNDPKELLEILKHYDKDNVNPALITKLENKIMNNKDFTYQRASECSYALKFLYSWVKAIYDYHKVYTETQPLRDELMAVKKVVAEKTYELQIKKEALEKINNRIKELEDIYNAKIQLKENLTREITECQIKKERAEKLTRSLSDEKVRWSQDIETIEKRGVFLAGDSIIASGMIAYAGPFTSQYRQELESSWVKNLKQLEIKHTTDITMKKFLEIPVVTQGWNINGLPKDDTSTENGLIIEKTRRWPLMIDPQTQANKFIKNMGKDKAEGLEIIKTSDPNLMRTIEKSVQLGQSVLLENVGKDLDPALEPILNQETKKEGTSLTLALGDKIIVYDEHFRFFMTTTLPNPHYSPETSVKVTIINFAITPSGLEEQMLARIVELENPQLEQKKNDIVRKNAADKKELLNIEDSILKSLSETKNIDELLMDETMINKLQTSKKFAAEINQRVKDSKITETQIDEARESYRPVAYRASLLFFCILDLSFIDPMYQYSLQWFSNLFSLAVENSPTSNVHETRLLNLNNFFTYSLYENVCRSLFEKHKLLLSLLLTVKILQGDHLLNEVEWRYLLAGPTGEINVLMNPTQWISENMWSDVYRQLAGLAQLEAFKGIDAFFMDNFEKFKPYYDSMNPQNEILPAPWNDKLNEFEKIMVLKALRPDKVIPATKNWISLKLGKDYIISPTFDLGKCYKDSTIYTPLIFVLSSGSDPVADFLRFAEEMSFGGTKNETISLGQGQGLKAEKMIKEGSLKGIWVLLQNCHLSKSWMPELERIVEEINENVHKDFRLWLSSMPESFFPISVLQNGIKMTMEPPKGLRNNLLRSYNNLDDKELNDCKKVGEFKKLLFGFCFFHAIIQDRRKFGPIGWNIAYEFTNEDLTVCKRQLKLFLDEYEEVPYKVLNYIGAEINYGGRVTDDKDVRLIKTILLNYINPDVLKDDYKFSTSGIYHSIAPAEQADYIRYIEGLPLDPNPEAFGLHENAAITNAQNETRELLETILSVQPRVSTKEGKSREEIIYELVEFVESRTPEVFDYDAIFKKYPTSYEESMNTVLVQEVIRYNRLLEIMKESLINIKKALKGLVVMSDELEALGNSLYDNQVPVLWADKGFLSLKALVSWTSDLNKRIKFLQKWIDEGTPSVFWVSGFFFPQAFITGTLQNYARKHTIAIDKLAFEFKYLDHVSHNEIKNKPKDGCYVYGIYLEGARWDYKKHMLGECKPKELFSDLPLAHFVPILIQETAPLNIYNCPLYKVESRRGTLSTTGHSTNFVMFMEMPSDECENKWIVGGLAAFLSLRY